jgi:hypothetical protein
MSNYFEALGRELVDAARRDAAPAIEGRRRPRRRARPAVLALALLAVAVPAAAGVREVFTPVREPDGLVRLSPVTVVAQGSLAVRGRWEMIASDSDVGSCLSIRFPDDPAGGGAGGGCGPPPGAGLVVGSTGGGDGKLPYVFSGVAPDQTTAVQVTDRHGRVLGRSSVQAGPSAHPGAFFALETTVERPVGCVQALDAHGSVLAEVDAMRLDKRCRAARGSRSPVRPPRPR